MMALFSFILAFRYEKAQHICDLNIFFSSFIGDLP
jgi:hypothetical protein